jgi:hypothetical protein
VLKNYVPHNIKTNKIIITMVLRCHTRKLCNRNIHVGISSFGRNILLQYTTYILHTREVVDQVQEDNSEPVIFMKSLNMKFHRTEFNQRVLVRDKGIRNYLFNYCL